MMWLDRPAPAARWRTGFVTLLCAGLCATAPAQTQFRTVFVVNNVSDEISVLRVQADGTLALLGSTPTSDWPTPIGVSPDGRYVAVAHATAGTDELLQVFEVAADGALALEASRIIPDAPLDLVWIGDRKLAVTQGNYGGANFVHTYDFDPKTNDVADVGSYDTGGFNTYLAYWPGASMLYAQDSFFNLIRWFAVNADGSLQLVNSISTGSVFPLNLCIAGETPYLYSACGISGGGHRVLGYSLGWDTGTPNPLPNSPFESPGQSPAYLAASEDGKWLFVGHGTDATLRSFAIAADGQITPTGYVFDVGLQGTLGDLAVVGPLLFVTDESTAIDGITGIYSFLINSDGSLSQLGDIIVLGVRPESIAVWDPGVVTGDMNCDGAVDAEDIDPFFYALGSPADYAVDNPGCRLENADANTDGAIDAEDIDPFFAILGGG